MTRPRLLSPSRILRSTIRAPGGGRRRDPLVEKSRKAIEQGSKSFRAASRLFDRVTRERIWMLYAWCRRCDDLADGQRMGRPAEGDAASPEEIATRVKGIRILTQAALDGQPTADVAFDAFGQVASECRLTYRDAEEVIAGFELDAKDWRPRNQDDLMRYCYHVAGAVGVMAALVMGVRRDDGEALDSACDLGIAFQLSNIARDLLEDDAAGRCYLPIEWLVEEDIEPGQHTKPHHRQELADMAARLITLMELHEAHARVGTARLRFRQRWAVLSAARIYGAIGREVRRLGTEAWNHRVYTSRWHKLYHAQAAFWEALVNRPPSPPALPRWTRARLAENIAAA
ncbi:phytoene/squalene synthase family protein [Altererythrobacter sp.]|uniref:phytoene/squalene synthase family protein n=1 Tax=Altererythrobacter sp. TaxID=1872480 RepID=UPI003D0B925F